MLSKWMVWPLPALLAWALAWAVFVWLGGWLPWWAALGAACAVGTVASLWGGTWWRRLMIAGGFPVSLAVMAASWAAGSWPAWGWLLPLGLLLLVYPLNAWRDAPVFPTPRGALDGLAQHIALPEGAAVLDAGCGAGDGLVALRRAWPQARLFGLEWSWPLRWVSALRCRWATVRRGDIWEVDWSPFEMVYLFQRPETMPRAGVKAMLDLREGAWLVSLNFPLPGVEPAHTVALADGRCVYAYRAPLGEAIDHEGVAAAEYAAARAELAPQQPRGIAVKGQALYREKSPPGGRRSRL